jgi:hypothetical protein
LANEKINDKIVKEIEHELSSYSHKTCNFTDFLLYVSKKNEINEKLFDHYSKFLYRKLRFNTIINTRRSEDNMVNEFKEKFGPPNKVIVVIGDYSSDHLKGTKPFLMTKWRKIFKRHGYEVYLIDEYNTSKISSCCHGYTENFVKRQHLKNNIKRERKEAYEKETGDKCLVWKLVRCTICKSIHNRDSNACNNMLHIIRMYLKGKKKPSKFRRPEKNETTKERIEKPSESRKPKTNKSNKKVKQVNSNDVIIV